MRRLALAALLFSGVLLGGAQELVAQGPGAAADVPAPAPAPTEPVEVAHGPIPFFPERGPTGKLKVCTSEYTPMVYCIDRNQDAFSGYEVELMKKVSRILGWDPAMLEWSCLAWDDMVASVQSGDGRCDLAVAGIEVTPELIADGVVFSRPTYQNGLKVLVKATPQTNGMWAFFDSFEVNVWVAALGTCVAVSLIIWAIDLFYYKYTVERFSRDPLKVPTPAETEQNAAVARGHKFERYFWEVLTRPMMTRDLVAYSNAGNVVATAMGFLLLILFTLYLGNTAANLTVLNLTTGGITGVDSLPGLAVGTWTDYVDKLDQRGVAAVGYPWDSTADETAMLDNVKSGSIRALVLDSAVMDYVSATDCEVTTVGDAFDQFDVAVAFPKGFNKTDLLAAYNNALVALEDSGEDEQLVNAFVAPPSSECGELYSPKVTLAQVAGLWVLLGASIGAALVWLLIVKLYENAMHRRLAGAQAPQGVEVQVDPKLSKLGVDDGTGSE